MAQKFIINNGDIVIGDVDFHKNLVKDHSTTKGGGSYFIDKELKTVYLWGASVDYGKCLVKDIDDAIHRGIVPEQFKNYEIRFSESLYGEDCVENGLVVRERKG